MKRRIFLGAIAALPAACVPAKPSFATKRELNTKFGRLVTPPVRLSFTNIVQPLGKDFRAVLAQVEHERAAIKAFIS